MAPPLRSVCLVEGDVGAGTPSPSVPSGGSAWRPAGEVPVISRRPLTAMPRRFSEEVFMHESDARRAPAEAELVSVHQYAGATRTVGLSAPCRERQERKR